MDPDRDRSVSKLIDKNSKFWNSDVVYARILYCTKLYDMNVLSMP